MTPRQFTITSQTGRIDKVIATQFNDITRSQAQKWLDEGRVAVNGKPQLPKYKVQAGDEVTLDPPKPVPLKAVPQDLPLDIVYQDDQVIVVNKPQGMVVHPAPGHPDGTLVNALLYHTDLHAINDVLRPGIVHRIDKDTSGLLMVAKTQVALESLQKQLKEKTSSRKYMAIVHGQFKEQKGRIDAPLGRDPKNRKKQAVVANGRHAVTHFEVLEQFERYALVQCILETGRTHQIRVHMAYIHHPVAGDPLYGPKRTLIGHGQFLHAATLGFTHPTTGKWLEFSIEPPTIFKNTLEDLRRGIDKTRELR